MQVTAAALKRAVEREVTEGEIATGPPRVSLCHVEVGGCERGEIGSR